MGVTIDLTGIAVAFVSLVGTVLSVVVPLMIQKYVGNRQAAQTLCNAVQNSLGAMQRATETGLRANPLTVPVSGLTPQMAVGLQYVLDHAGEEAKRLGITKEKLISKIEARIGLANIATNIATASSPAPSPPPLAPVPRVVGIVSTTEKA
jgi:hypothetical protein